MLKQQGTNLNEFLESLKDMKHNKKKKKKVITKKEDKKEEENQDEWKRYDC